MWGEAPAGPSVRYGRAGDAELFREQAVGAPETGAPMDLLDVLIGDASRKYGDGCGNGQAEAKPRASLGWRTL